jgi:hypothetical protein
MIVAPMASATGRNAISISASRPDMGPMRVLTLRCKNSWKVEGGSFRRPCGFEFCPLLEGRRPPPESLPSFLVSPETDLDFLLIEDPFASIVVPSQEAS